jgi:hypothetical protein
MSKAAEFVIAKLTEAQVKQADELKDEVLALVSDAISAGVHPGIVVRVLISFASCFTAKSYLGGAHWPQLIKLEIDDLAKFVEGEKRPDPPWC